nr:transposase [Nitrosospira sp.]
MSNDNVSELKNPGVANEVRDVLTEVLREGARTLLAQAIEIWRKHGISSATYYKWKARYGGLEVSELVRVKELEAENSQLK